jgi:hypothetical protein
MKMTKLALIATATAAATAMIGAAAAAPSAAAPNCPPSGTGPPPLVAQRSIASLDGGDQPDTLWIGVVPNPGGGATRLVGITTASGAELGPVSVEITASPMPLRAVVVDAEGNGDHQLIVSDGRAARLYVISGCRIQPVVNAAGGAPFGFDMGNWAGTGTGIGCSDLGDGRHLVGLQALQQDSGWIVLRREIDFLGTRDDGTVAAIGRSDTVTASSAEDSAVTTAQTISCGEITIDQDGVSQPQG